MLEQSSREKRQQYVQQMSEWKTRVLDKQNEVSRKSHEDGLKHLQVKNILPTFLKRECIREVVRIGCTMIFHLNKL